MHTHTGLSGWEPFAASFLPSALLPTSQPPGPYAPSTALLLPWRTPTRLPAQHPNKTVTAQPVAAVPILLDGPTAGSLGLQIHALLLQAVEPLHINLCCLMHLNLNAQIPGHTGQQEEDGDLGGCSIQIVS